MFSLVKETRWHAHVPLKTNNSDRIAENPMVFCVFIALIEGIGFHSCHCTSTFRCHQNSSSDVKSLSKQSAVEILPKFMASSQDANLLFYVIFRNGKHDLSPSYFILASWIGKYILCFSRYFIIITIFLLQKI